MRVMDEATGEAWTLYNGDSSEVLRGIPDHSIGHAVFSPPFSSLYTYTPSARDLGNVRSREEFFEHHTYIRDELARVLMPGRVIAAHTAELQKYGTRDGRRGRYDFPGDYIRHMEAGGLTYCGRISIQKNPQTQAIRNHPQELLFATMRKDATKLVPALADYLLVFRAPGENTVPVERPINEEEWIRWAHPVWQPPFDAAGAAALSLDAEMAAAWFGLEPVWDDIREMDILPVGGSKENDDERHLCPLQLPVIERCIRLWSNPGETVLSPFAGIGSEGVASLRCKRRFVGCELKPSYFNVAKRFLTQAEASQSTQDMFSLFGGEPETAPEAAGVAP